MTAELSKPASQHEHARPVRRGAALLAFSLAAMAAVLDRVARAGEEVRRLLSAALALRIVAAYGYGYVGSATFPSPPRVWHGRAV